jgi:trk system potassium uptake protein TrkA
VAVDQDREKVQRMQEHASYAIVGDAANKEFLKGQGLHEMDAAVISTGERSHLSTLITLYLRELGLKRILVKAHDEDHGRILEKVGASDIIFPEKDMAVRTARGLGTPNVLEFIPLAEDYSITEAAPSPAFLGRSLVELDLRRLYNVTIIGIKDVLTGAFVAVPPPAYVIKDSDLLIFIGRTEDVERACRHTPR